MDIMRMKWRAAGRGLACLMLVWMLTGCQSGVIGGGTSGTPADGRDGIDGLNCWDLNGNRQADVDEDINRDGVFDALDCQGVQGSVDRGGADGFDGLSCWDLNANGVPDAGEDTNGDGRFDAWDCQGAAGDPGLTGPEHFDIYVDSFFTLSGAAGDGATTTLMPVNQPALGTAADGTSASSEPILFNVPIPEVYSDGNDVTMRAYFMRAGTFDQGCFAFTVDTERARAGGGSEPYGERRYVRVDAVDAGDTDGSLDTGRLVLVDVPVNTSRGLDLPPDLTGGDFLGFSLETFWGDGRTYYLLGVEFFESTAGAARPIGAGVFTAAGDVVCDFPDCNRNFIPDSLDIDAGTSRDCNLNGTPDRCELDAGTSDDCNGNDVPDECDLCGGPGAVAGAGQQPFAFLQAGFSQQLYATGDALVGGIAFAPDGDLLVDQCLLEGGDLHRFDAQTTIIANGTAVHPWIDTLPSNAGCGLANHPDGSLYSNTVSGVVNLDADTGAELRPALGPGGNALGITADPLTGELIYVGADGTLYFASAAFDARGVFSEVLQGDLIQGIVFAVGGGHLLCANRSQMALSVLARDGTLIQSVPLWHNDRTREPMAVAVHRGAPAFVVAVNADGSMTRLDFPADDFAAAPAQSLFASGGFRADMAQVGVDGCLYVTQTGTRFLDGTVSLNDRSIVRVCGGFLAQPGAIGSIDLSPTTSIAWVGSQHTVSADVVVAGVPAGGVAVVFEVVSGPQSGLTAGATTDADGHASFSYAGVRGAGTDQIQATVSLPDGILISNIGSVTWTFPDCSLDCNENGTPDECELAGNDCNDNGVPDECDGGCP